MARSIAEIVLAMRGNPKGHRFTDAMKVAEHYFGTPRQRGGSHCVFKTPWPGDPRVNLQKSQGGDANLIRSGSSWRLSTDLACWANGRSELMDHYTYRVTWSGEDQEFVGTCIEFPSLSHLHPTRGEALTGIEALVTEVVQDMAASGEPVPEPLAERSFSGSFLARVPPELHRKLAIEAAEAGVSLNRLVSFKLAMTSTPAPASAKRATR